MWSLHSWCQERTHFVAKGKDSSQPRISVWSENGGADGIRTLPAPSCGRQATTFPMLSGRANQLLNPMMAFHPFDLAFPPGYLGAGGELLRMDQLPRAAVLK